ncbi:carboxylesterase family protein [Sarocladium implicatum]|nr:carboxylesterase family protein [Sarocladium implicatum]
MRFFIPLLLSVVPSASALCKKTDTCSGNLTVTTNTGSYTGIVDEDFPNTRQWRSIPFAEPPVASRRWLPPQPLAPSDEHRYSNRFPQSCAQFVTADPQMYFWASDLTRGNLIYNGAQNDSSGLVSEASSEDCLNLAVWAPSAETPVPEGGFPVIFFMTGGGFTLGGVNIPWQMPTGWVERSQSHIIVTINYRLGIFGFPLARGLSGKDFSQNLGILDQRMALEWVRDNIAAFGGNPDRITQWGRSAGGRSADIHAYAYHDDPIAQGYWIQSGIALGSYWEDPTFSNFSAVAQHFGCKSTCHDEDRDEAAEFELDCMRQVSFLEIVNFIGQYIDRYEEPLLFFSPSVDGKIIFDDHEDRSKAGLVADRPIILSTTANEWGSLWGWNAEDPAEGFDQDVVDEWNTDQNCRAFNATRLRNANGIPVFRFQYAGIFPNLNVYDWLGAYHASDIPASFGTYHLMDHIAPSTKLQAETSRAMQDYVAAFARDPYNGPQREFGWEPMDTSEDGGGMLLRLGAGDKAVRFIDGVEVDGVCEGKGEYDSFP